MPCDYKRYPADWPEITRRVKEAAGWRCEFCGAPHGVTVARASGGFWSPHPDQWHDRHGQPVSVYAPYGEAEYGPEGHLLPKGRLWQSKVVLTSAHLGPNRHDKMDCSHLKALCQSCHLAADHADHIAHAKANRAAKKARLQPALDL